MKRLFIIFNVAVVLAVALPLHASKLSDLITAMRSSTDPNRCTAYPCWREVDLSTTTGLYTGGGTNNILNGNVGPCMEFQDKFAWDDHTQTAYIECGEHAYSGVPFGNAKKFIVWNSVNDTWTQPTMPLIGSSGEHQYSRNIIDSYHRRFFIQEFTPANTAANPADTAGTHVQLWDLDLGGWTTIGPNLSSNNQVNGAGLWAQEYFPDLDPLFFGSIPIRIFGQGGGIVYLPSNGTHSASQLLYVLGVSGFVQPIGTTCGNCVANTSNTAGLYKMGTLQTVMYYNPVYHFIMFGGGIPCANSGSNPCVGNSDDNCGNCLYKMDRSGQVTQLATCSNSACFSNLPISHNEAANEPNGQPYFSINTTYQYVSPVTGKFYVWEDHAHGVVYDPATNSWSAYSGPANIVPDFSGNPAAANIMVTQMAGDYGANLIIKFAGPSSVRMFVFIDSPPPAFTSKCLPQTGVLVHCWPFDTQSFLKYFWDGNPAVTSYINSIPGADTNMYALTPTRAAGEGNTKAFQQVFSPGAGLSVPIVDTTTKFEGAGSILFTVPQYADASGGGKFQDNIDGVLHSNGADNVYMSPASPFGYHELWLQGMLRVNSAFHDYIYEYSTDENVQGNAGSNNLFCGGCILGTTDPHNGFISAQIGKQITLIDRNGQCMAGTPKIRTITAVANAQNITLDGDPNNGSGGSCFAEAIVGNLSSTGNPSLYSGAPGWKNMAVAGEAPGANSDGSSFVSAVIQNSAQTFYPQIYSRKGLCTPDVVQNVRPYLIDQWIQITIRVVPINNNTAYFACGNSAPPYANTRYTLWVDNLMVIDWAADFIAWDSDSDQGFGLGQFDMEPFHTRRDPLQATSGPSKMWWDNLLVMACAANCPPEMTPPGTVPGINNNPPPPTLTSIAPNSANQGTVTAVSVVGSGFVNGGTTCSVGGNGITSGSFNFSDTAHGTCAITVSSNTAAGIYSFNISTANGTSSPLNFTVNAVVTGSSSFTMSMAGSPTTTTNGQITYNANFGNSGNQLSGTFMTALFQLNVGQYGSSFSGQSNINSLNCTNMNMAGALVKCSISLVTGLAAGSGNGAAAFQLFTVAGPSTGTIVASASVDPTGGASPPSPVGCGTSNCANFSTAVTAQPTPTTVRLKLLPR